MSNPAKVTPAQDANQVISQWNAAVNDTSFRKALKTDPHVAMKEQFGADMPEQLEIHVHEQSDDELHIVLPQAAESGELSDADLQAVSGGFTLIELLARGRELPQATKGGF